MVGGGAGERLAGHHPAREGGDREAVAARTEAEPVRELREGRIDEAGRERPKGERSDDDDQRATCADVPQARGESAARGRPPRAGGVASGPDAREENESEA